MGEIGGKTMSPVLYGKNAGRYYVVIGIIFWLIALIPMLLYIEDPTDSANCVIFSVLVFGGLGSFMIWRGIQIIKRS